MESDDYSKFFSEFISESNRAAIVLGAAQMDDLLLQILRRRLLNPPKEFFEYQGPLGTFSSRIDMANAAGVLSKEFSRRLDLVRKIRNECAHSITKVELAAAPFSDLLRELIAGFDKSEIWTDRIAKVKDDFSEKRSPNDDRYTDASLDLRLAIAGLIADLAMVLRYVKEIDDGDIFEGVILGGGA